MAMYMYFQKIKFSPLGIYAGVGKVDFMKYVNQIIHISLFKNKISWPLNSPEVEFNFFYGA